MTRLVHAVMCGGSGTRLWPWSRPSRPKQFLTVTGDRSLLQAAVARLEGFSRPVETIVIGSEDHRFLIAEQLRAVSGVAEIVLEPEPHNTAPVALIAALRAKALLGEDDGLVLLAPADHIISDIAAFHAAIGRAIPAALAGNLVTFGIDPALPETGYGYIEIGDALPDAPGVSRARGFREKPDRATAEAYLASGDFFWNAGIFLFAPGMLLAAAETLHPAMAAACRVACERACPDPDFVRLDAEAYGRLETISFDHAFAERLDGRVAVVPVSMGWSDIGSWRALRDVHVAGTPGTPKGSNATTGPVELFDCSGSLAFSDGVPVVALGLTDVVVVATGEAVYVAPMDRAGDIKALLTRLKTKLDR